LGAKRRGPSTAKRRERVEKKEKKNLPGEKRGVEPLLEKGGGKTGKLGKGKTSASIKGKKFNQKLVYLFGKLDEKSFQGVSCQKQKKRKY